MLIKFPCPSLCGYLEIQGQVTNGGESNFTVRLYLNIILYFLPDIGLTAMPVWSLFVWPYLEASLAMFSTLIFFHLFSAM